MIQWAPLSFLNGSPPPPPRGVTYSTDYYKRLTLESWFTNLEQKPLNRYQQQPTNDLLTKTNYRPNWLTIQRLKLHLTIHGSKRTYYWLESQQPITSRLNWPMTATTDVYTMNWRFHNSLDSEDAFRSGCRNVSQCQQQQFFLELHQPGRSHSTDYWYSWVQTIYNKTRLRILWNSRKLKPRRMCYFKGFMSPIFSVTLKRPKAYFH